MVTETDSLQTGPAARLQGGRGASVVRSLPLWGRVRESVHFSRSGRCRCSQDESLGLTKLMAQGVRRVPAIVD